MLLIISLVLVAILAYYFGINRMLGLPPGPPPLPLIGNMLSFSWEIDKVFLDWKSRYGKIFTVWMPFPIVVIGDYKVLQEHVAKGGDVFLGKKNPEQMMNIMAGGLYGLGFEDNSIVKEQRKFALKALHEVGFGSAALEDAVHHYALEIVTRWKTAGDKAVDVSENLMRAVSNVVWNIIFGTILDFDNPMLLKFRDLAQQFVQRSAGPFMMFLEAFPWLAKFDSLLGNKIKLFRETMDETNQLLKEAIALCEKSFNPDNTPSCYVEAFLQEQKKREENGTDMGNYHFTQLLASANTLWGAGVETTISVLRYCIIEMVNHPEIQKKLQGEIDTLGGRRIRNEDQKQLPYLSAFIQEAYRLGHILPFNFLRQAMENTEIEGHPIAAGTTVLPQFSMVHVDPEEFERPDYFCPERYIDQDGKFVKDPRVMPFSIGRRACLGETLARMEVFVILATIIQHCNFTPVGKIPPAISFNTNFARAVKPFDVKIQARI